MGGQASKNSKSPNGVASKQEKQNVTIAPRVVASKQDRPISPERRRGWGKQARKTNAPMRGASKQEK